MDGRPVVGLVTDR